MLSMGRVASLSGGRGGSGGSTPIAMHSPASTPTASAMRGSFSSAGLGVGGIGLGGGATAVSMKRSSIFAQPADAAISTQARLQRSIFTKLHEEIFTVLQVLPKVKPASDVLASFGVAQTSLHEDQAYFLVLTSATLAKKSPDGFGAPKLHWVKIKQPEHAGGELSYNYKKFKLLKLLKRIEMSGSNMTTAGGSSMVGGGASGALKREQEQFTLVFRSGDTDKFYTFALAGSTSRLLPTAASTVNSPDRSVFVWYLIEICRSYCGFVPTSNIDTVLYQQLTNEITSYYLADPPPVNVSAHLRGLLQSVSKNRNAIAEHDSKQLTRNKIEEKVIVPSMTAEETALVQVFLKQIESAMNPNAAATKNAAHPHSYLNELESFLTHKLSVIEHQNIQSLFDSRQESINARILSEDIQANLLDSKLEEMSLWINHHNLELNKMKKGIELIEKRNMSLDIQEKNQTQLYDVLKSVLDSLKLDSDPARSAALEAMLEQPDFGSNKLSSTLHAVKQLDHVLQMEIGEGKLEDLQSIKEQRAKYAVIRSKFSHQAEAALEAIFVDVSRRAVGDAEKDAGNMRLDPNTSIHRDLRRYAELLRYLERLELPVFLGLRHKYTAAVRSVYEVKTRLFFAALRKAIAIEHKESHLKDFPDWSIELATHATRRSEGGRNISTSHNAAMATVLRAGPNQPLPQLQSAKVLATQAFVNALQCLTPSCLAEEKFLNEFFGLSHAPVDARADKAPTLTKESSVAPGLSHQVSTSTLLQNYARARGSVSAGPLPPPAALHTKSDVDEIKSLMGDLFRGLEPELRELSAMASKMDHFYTLEMLVQCERIMAASAAAAAGASSTAGNSTSCEFLESIITNLSTHLKLAFTSFIDSEIEWFSSQKPNPKRCGVLGPVLKFPALVDRMENIVWTVGAEGKKVSGSRSQAADTSYQKLASALFRWLDGVAKSDEKYTDVVWIENGSYFVSLFTTAHLTVPVLEQFVAKAESKFAEHMRAYVQWNINYEMPAIAKFWNKLEEQLKSIQPEDIPFASELSKHDLRAVTKGPLSGKLLQKSIAEVLKRVQKHMPKNPHMIQTVWHQITQTFLTRLARFEQLVSQCYQNEKLQVTQAEAADMFAQLLPSTSGSAAARTPAATPSP